MKSILVASVFVIAFCRSGAGQTTANSGNRSNAGCSWPGTISAQTTVTVLATTHGCGISPQATVFDNSVPPKQVWGAPLSIAANGDVTMAFPLPFTGSYRISSASGSGNGGLVGLVDTLTQRGDILARFGGNVTNRLPLGAANTVLISNGTDLAYSNNLVSVNTTGTAAGLTGYTIPGTGTALAATLGARTSGKCLEYDGNGNVTVSVSNGPCGTGGFSDPLTNVGDLNYKNGANVTTRLPLVPNNVLTSNGTLPVWAATLPPANLPNAGVHTGDVSGTFPATLVKQIHETITSVAFGASPYTVLAADSYIYCNATGGAVVLNLPATTGGGREVTAKKIDSSANACTLTRAGSDVIDGATTVVLSAQYVAAKLIDRAAGTWDRAHINQLGGDVGGASSGNVVTKINGTQLSSLATGILRNTTGTGVPSIAVGADMPTGIPAANSTYTQSGTGAVARTQAELNSDIVSVKDFGVTGDGTTDDTANAQLAMNHACLDGGPTKELYFPPGTYKLTSALTCTLTAGNVGVIISGAGPSTTLLLAGTTNGGILFTGSSALAKDQIYVRNLRVKSATSGTAAYGIKYVGATGMGMLNVDFIGQNKMSYGAWLVGTQQGYIRGGSNLDTKIGIRLEKAVYSPSNAIDISDITFTPQVISGSACLEIEGADGGEFQDNHCTSGNYGVHFVGTSVGNLQYHIQKNHFELLTVQAIKIDTGLNISVDIGLNNFVDLPASGGGPSPDLSLLSSGTVTVTNNLINGDVTFGAACLKCTFTLNTVAGIVTDSSGALMYHSNIESAAKTFLTGAKFRDPFIIAPISAATPVGDLLSLLPAPVSGAWGMSITGFGANQDVYYKFHDVILAGNTAGGVFRFKSGVAGTTWATVNATGIATDGVFSSHNANPYLTLQNTGSGDGGVQFRNNTLTDLGGFFSNGATGGVYISTYAKANAIIIAPTTGNVTIAASTTLGGTGTAIAKFATYTASLTPAAVAANTCAEQTFTVTGVAAADTVLSVNKPTAQAGLSIGGWRASALNTVGITYCNNTAGAPASITPTAAETYKFAVVQ